MHACRVYFIKACPQCFFICAIYGKIIMYAQRQRALRMSDVNKESYH